MKAVGLQMALDLLHEKDQVDLLTGLKTRTQAGRPNWDQVLIFCILNEKTACAARGRQCVVKHLDDNSLSQQIMIFFGH